MKRVLYNTSIADPFVKVAQKLRDENGYEPVYWIGFDYDHSDEIVPQTFPNCVYQSYPDAWHGIFSKDIQEKAASCYLDVDMLNRLARYELQALTMMNRMDHDRYSFNLMERERHYLNLMKCWMAVIESYQIDMVVSSVAPHRVYDYVLYLLCKEKGIRFITFQYTLTSGRVYATDNIYTNGDIFDADYLKYRQQDGLSTDMLPTDIREAFDKVQLDYEKAKPFYMNAHNIADKSMRNIFKYAKRYWGRYSFKEKMQILRRGKIGSTMRKERGCSLETSSETLWQAAVLDIKANRDRDRLKKHYDSLTSQPKSDEKYIFLPLHYQPEATTCPAGDIFANQRLCIETILKNTPDDYLVYVKEHPQQFQSHMLGQTCRNKDFYSDIVKSSRVKLMPLEMNSFSIMKNAKAVATVTGTVGWEAVMHHIPVIIFGIIWYERMPGVLRVTDSESARKIMPLIENYSFSEHDILAYLLSVADNTKQAYHYAGEKERTGISESDSVRNLASVILSFEKQL